MKTYNVIVLLNIFLLLFFCPSCSSNSKVDEFLDKYESYVEKWEKIANSGNFSIDDITEINKDYYELLSAGEKLKEDTDWTESQEKRYLDLTSRFSKAMMKMSKSQHNFNY